MHKTWVTGVSGRLGPLLAGTSCTSDGVALDVLINALHSFDKKSSEHRPNW